MKTTNLIGLVLVASVLLVPTASAAPPGLCDFVRNTMCHVPGEIVSEAKKAVGELDPRDWPCTCDPQPDPGP